MHRLVLALALLATPATAVVRPHNIVAVSVDRQAALAIDTKSIVHYSDMPNIIELEAYTVFGQARGPARAGYVLAGVYDFECDDTPRLRAVAQKLLDRDGRVVAQPQEPWINLDFSRDRYSHTYHIFTAACSVEKVRQPEGAKAIYEFRDQYLRMLREGMIR